MWKLIVNVAMIYGKHTSWLSGKSHILNACPKQKHIGLHKTSKNHVGERVSWNIVLKINAVAVSVYFKLISFSCMLSIGCMLDKCQAVVYV